MPDISFQPNKIFVRNGLFEKIIESCKATNLEFLKLKEKLGLCIYEEICDEKEFILMSEKSFIQHDVENKQLKEENEKLRKENENENEQFQKNNIVKDANIKELIEEPKEIKSPNWLDKNKFKEILTIIDSNKFGHKNKIGDFKYIDIKDLVNNIKNNTISEIDAKKDLNKLNKIKNAQKIKYKKRTPGHKILLNLFNDLLDTILTDKTLESESQENKNVYYDDDHKNEYEIMMMIIKTNMKIMMMIIMMIIEMNMNMKIEMMKQ